MTRVLMQRIPDRWKWSFFVWVCARLVLTLWSWFLWTLDLPRHFDVTRLYYDLRPILTGPEAVLVGAWQRWDAIHYMRIAADGYYTPQLSAFFPLYPMLGGLLHRLTGMEVTAALMVVSNAAFLLALVVLYEIVEEMYSRAAARGTVLAAAFFPTAIFFFAPYPQSLALLLVLFSYQSARKDRWLLATLGALAAGLCHSTVIPLAFLLGWEAVRRVRTAEGILKWMAVLAPAAPFLGVGLFLAWRIFMGFPSLPALMVEEWGRTTQWPWLAVSRLPELFAHDFLQASGGLNMLLLLVYIFILIRCFRRLAFPHLVYSAILLISLLSMDVEIEPLSSFSRYILLAFPLFIGLAELVKRPALRLAMTALATLLYLYVNTLFFMWVWVA